MLSKNPPVEETAIRKLVAESGLELPEEYLSFLKLSNGGELNAESGHFHLYPAEEVIQANLDLRVQEFLPGFFIFGGDGANELLAFNMREPEARKVYVVPMIGMGEEDAVMIADSFKSFIAGASPPDDA